MAICIFTHSEAKFWGALWRPSWLPAHSKNVSTVESKFKALHASLAATQFMWLQHCLYSSLFPKGQEIGFSLSDGSQPTCFETQPQALPISETLVFTVLQAFFIIQIPVAFFLIPCNYLYGSPLPCRSLGTTGLGSIFLLSLQPVGFPSTTISSFQALPNLTDHQCPMSHLLSFCESIILQWRLNPRLINIFADTDWHLHLQSSIICIMLAFCIITSIRGQLSGSGSPSHLILIVDFQ